VARLDQEEQTDLDDVGAGREVDQVVLAVAIEAVAARELVERGEHLLEVPRVGDRQRPRHHLGRRRDLGQIVDHLAHHRPGGAEVPQLEAIDRQLGVLGQRHGRAPAPPAVGLAAGVEGGADEAEDDAALARHGEIIVSDFIRRDKSVAGRSWASAPLRRRWGAGRPGTPAALSPTVPHWSAVMTHVTNLSTPAATLASPADRGYQLLDVAGGVPVKAWTRGVAFEAEAQAQLARLATLPFLHRWVAAMPDVHAGLGATVGSVIATKGAIIPAAVGVDLGCGMIATRTSLSASQLPDDLAPLRSAIEAAVPHGRTANGGPRRSRRLARPAGDPRGGLDDAGRGLRGDRRRSPQARRRQRRQPPRHARHRQPLHRAVPR
jgi:hypothetical protein